MANPLQNWLHGFLLLIRINFTVAPTPAQGRPDLGKLSQQSGAWGKRSVRKEINIRKEPLHGDCKTHPALRTLLQIWNACTADNVGCLAPDEDWGLGWFQADWALQIFFLLFDGRLEKLDHLAGA